jgi:hypothetical protein
VSAANSRLQGKKIVFNAWSVMGGIIDHSTGFSSRGGVQLEMETARESRESLALFLFSLLPPR